jgi:hypothetical protein
MTDTDITEVWEAINRLSARLDTLEAAKAMQYGTMGSSGDSDAAVITPAAPNAPGLDTYDSGRVRYGAGMMRY